MDYEDSIAVSKAVLLQNKLTISEYLFLQLIYNIAKMSTFEVDREKEIIGKVDYLNLEKEGFIKITATGLVYRPKTEDLFKKDVCLFYRFLSTFPIKTPSGRYLSPKNPDGIAVKKIKERWDRLFKGNEVKESHVIKVLEAELEYRKKKNEMEFMNSIEAWINMANYEKYEYLIQDNKEESEIEEEDLM